jgi:hypothetical protein
MTNHQAAHLEAGTRVRRKGAGDGGAVYVVERIERIPRRQGADIRVHAGGEVFWSWEVERVDPFQGWPATP